MRQTGDYHTHTMFSHGDGMIEDNVKAAIAAGLDSIAITDHGFRHVAFCVRRSDFPYLRKEVTRLRQLYPNIRILLGLETNIQGNNGQIDLADQDVDKLDILVCGYHKYVHAPNLAQAFSFWLPTFGASIFGTTARRRAKNTDAFIKAIERYPIDIISHPKHCIDVDVKEIALAAKAKGTFMELNGKSINMTDAEIEAVVDTGVGLIVNSDAHSPSRVGEISKPMSVIERLHIPASAIVNMDKTPTFRSHVERGLKL